MAQAGIFLPVLTVVAVSIVGFFWLARMRVKAVRGREVPIKYYTAFQGGAEPHEAAVAARHYNNLFEAPVLFYVACVVAYQLAAVTLPLLVTAWGYAAARIAQSAVHLTANRVDKRAYAFFIGWLFLIGLWAQVAVAIVGKI
ncbi:MAG: MAPEG family protein [Rhodospirillaceae bacterium]|nr:MAPEG family protein [Rhodospirillaceae bacterium]